MQRATTAYAFIAGAWLVAAALIVGPVRAEPLGDAWITAKAKIALLSSQEVDGLGINVDTVDGRVTLHGKVEEESQTVRAAEIVKKIEGVREVKSMLSVVPGAARPAIEREDAELQRQIETVLKQDAALETSDISVASVHDGNVVLSGEAATLSAHQRALEDVRAVRGVRGISSEIESPDRLGDAEIDPDQEPGSSSSAASDLWITTKTKLRLMAEPGLSPLAIHVDTRRGVVTLFGAVDSEQTKAQAGDEAQKVAGVRAVQNELQVVPEESAESQEEVDGMILKGVEDRIAGSPELKDARIRVAVENSVVRLSGTVRSEEDRMRALTLAREASGVDSVLDALELSAPRS